MKILILIFTFLSLSNGWSQTYNLTICKKNGTTTSFPIQEIKKITFNGITNIEKTKKLNNIIKNFILFQNHPNPFNPGTTIEYELPKPGNVTLTIFDVVGQQVKKFSNNSPAGINKTIWDGKNSKGDFVASGIYFYRVKFENSILSRKMIIVK
jgi:hypothetical protein